MTSNGGADDDAEAFWILVRAISDSPAGIDGFEAREMAQHLFERADALELAREALLEERLLRELHAEAGVDLVRGSGPRRNGQRAVLPMPSLVARAVDSKSRLSGWTLGLAAAAVLAVGVGLNWRAATSLLRMNRAGGMVESGTIVTRAAELDTVNLPDGSRAIVAANSRLRYSMAPLAGPRELQLEGEALFDVRHDEERPFRVRTRRVVVEDLGTTFVVREYGQDSRARVTVRTGAATLRANDGSGDSRLDLRPGDGAYIDSSGAIARFTGDPESFGAWAAGRLAFDGALLPEVLAQLGTWYGVEFRLTDSTLTKQHFTGGLSSTSLPKALAILGPIVHARFEREGRLVQVSTRPDGR